MFNRSMKTSDNFSAFYFTVTTWKGPRKCHGKGHGKVIEFHSWISVWTMNMHHVCIYLCISIQIYIYVYIYIHIFIMKGGVYINSFSWYNVHSFHMDGSMQEIRNSSALTLELRFSCINPSIWCYLLLYFTLIIRSFLTSVMVKHVAKSCLRDWRVFGLIISQYSIFISKTIKILAYPNSSISMPSRSL